METVAFCRQGRDSNPRMLAAVKRLRTGLLLAGLAGAMLAAGCGDDDGVPDRGPATTLEVSSGGQYKDTALPIADKVLAVRDDLPSVDQAGGRTFRQTVTAMADDVQELSGKLMPVTPPQQVLSEHQFLTDAVTIIEFDLRDLAAARDAKQAAAAKKRLESDFNRLEDLTNQIKTKLE
jgi:hypothetical protein